MDILNKTEIFELLPKLLLDSLHSTFNLSDQNDT